MTLSERFAGIYGPRPIQIIDPTADPKQAHERRFLIGQATYRADRLLQVQIIYLCGLVFGCLIAPPVIVVSAYALMQLSELHALLIFRRLIRDAQDPQRPLTAHRSPIARYEMGAAAAISISLLLGYLVARDPWSMGVLAVWGLGAIYFAPGAKHDALTLYGSLGVMVGAMAAAVIIRAAQASDFSLSEVGPPLALVVFTAVTSFATGANARLEHFMRLDHEELLEHAVARINAESQAKSVLLAQLSHEIRTPLNGVLGAAELLKTKDMPDDQRVLVNIMRESGCNLVNLLDRMLEISASEVDAIAIRPAPAVLARVIAEEVALFGSRAQQAGVKLVVNDGFCELPRQMDEVRVRQCIANLITNAIDHSGGDEITLSCVEVAETSVTILVSDNGCGVPPHRRKLIFQAFGDKGLEGPYEGQGAGIGLALSRSIARAMGGDLTLREDVRDGSVFVFSFNAPLIAADAESNA